MRTGEDRWGQVRTSEDRDTMGHQDKEDKVDREMRTTENIRIFLSLGF